MEQRLPALCAVQLVNVQLMFSLEADVTGKGPTSLSQSEKGEVRLLTGLPGGPIPGWGEASIPGVMVIRLTQGQSASVVEVEPGLP